MAAILLDNQVATSTSATTQITVNLGQVPSSGDRLIAFVGHSDDYPNVPVGWTQIAESVQSGVIRVFSKLAGGSESTILNFTAPSPGGFTARVVRYSGLGNLDTVGGSASSGTNQILFGNVVTVAANTLLFASGLLHGTSLPVSDMTWSNSFTPIAADIQTSGTGKQAQLGLAIRSVTSASTYTTTASYAPTSSTGIEGVIFAFGIDTTTAGNVYFRRGGNWVHSTVVRKIRDGGTWVTL